MGQSSPVVQTLPQTLTLPIVFPASVIFNQVSSRLIYLHLPTTGTLLPSVPDGQMEVTNLHTGEGITSQERPPWDKCN